MTPNSLVSAAKQAGLSPALRALRDALTVVEERTPLLALALPLTTVSVANEHAHWRRRSMRAKAQRSAVRIAVVTAVRSRGWSPLLERRAALVVLLTRVAPRELDSDNLGGALKSVRDGVADALGIDDRDPRVTWLYDQRKGRCTAVEIAVYAGRSP